MQDPLGAFMPDGLFSLQETEVGPLAGLTFAVKDLFDVAGQATSAGNPAFRRDHPEASAHAASVARLLSAGARLIGKTITDEFAYGMNGINGHYGAPTNSEAPGRVTGGSSSGSAAAVAGGLCDFALGSDTGGSVRVPASYCGLFGLRPTHGRVPLIGVVPLAPSFDTVGWFARDAALLARVAALLLNREAVASFEPRRLLLAEDAFALLDPAVRTALDPQVKRLKDRFGSVTAINLAGPMGNLENLREVFRLVQAREAWTAQGDWVTRHWEDISPDVAERFRQAAAVTDVQVEAAEKQRVVYTEWLSELLHEGALLCLPSALGPAPRLDQPIDSLGEWRLNTLRISCASPLARTPQISLPVAQVGGLPMGLSLMAQQGGDETLLAFAGRFTQTPEPGSQLDVF